MLHPARRSRRVHKAGARGIDNRMQVDPFGICAHSVRVANQEPLDSLLQEIFGNRKHGKIPREGHVKYLAALAKLDGRPVFLLGSTQHRTEESIIKEHTLFNFTAKQADMVAKLGTRGQGAKLLPFKIGGEYEVWFRLQDGDEFSVHAKEWGLKQTVDISNLMKDVHTNQTRDGQYLTSRYSTILHIPSTEAKTLNTFKLQALLNKPLMDFVTLHNFKYFQVFTGYQDFLPAQLRGAMQTLANYYEINKDIQLYYFNELHTGAPEHLVAVGPRYGLCPEDWVGSFSFDWKLGKRHSSGKYFENQLRWTNPVSGTSYYAQISSNGSTEDHKKFARRTKSILLSEEEKQAWTPDLRITIPMVKSELANTSFKQFWLLLEEDLISDKTGLLGCDAKLRNMGEFQSRQRYIVRILSEAIKDHKDAGLSIEGVKRKSSIQQSQAAIHEMLVETLKLVQKIFQKMQSVDTPAAYVESALLDMIPKIIEMDKLHAEKTKKRRNEGIKFEAIVKANVQEDIEELDDCGVEWETNDAEISVKHDLGDENQGIDFLGSVSVGMRTIRFACQMKDKTMALTDGTVEKFTKTVDALRAKYPNDTVYSFLVVANPKCVNGGILEKLQDADASVVIENKERKGDQLTARILNEFHKMYPVD